MAHKPVILEMGTGNDLYGEDYTKAALRAVQDAIHHSSISLFSSLDIDSKDMIVDVLIGVQDPDKVDVAAIEASLPRGQAKVSVVKGGLNIEDKDNNRTSVIANAAVRALVDIPEGKFVLSSAK
jgi:uncharacterized protein (TIGR02058 family)